MTFILIESNLISLFTKSSIKEISFSLNISNLLCKYSSVIKTSKVREGIASFHSLQYERNVFCDSKSETDIFLINNFNFSLKEVFIISPFAIQKI